MRLSSIEKKLREQIEPRIRDVTPGLLLRAYSDGRQVVDLAIGETFPYYDLASLTKIIFSVQACMLAFDQKKWNLDSKINEFLSWFPNSNIRVQDLLTHSSGLPWWEAFYKKIDLNLNPEQRREQLKSLLLTCEIQPQDVSVYSDVGIILLGFILEEWFQKDLISIWSELKEKFYLGTTLDFHPGNEPKNPRHLYAPTEECPWRQKKMQGEVHDENAWSFGGVSTHSGLFGSIDDVASFLLNLRSQILGIARYHIKQKTAQLFAQRARPAGTGDWALGYMLPSPGTASCGFHFSLTAIGHTGFTGTSVWYDHKMDLGIVILSNRVAFGRENKNFQGLRPEIHNWVVEALRKASF